MGESWLIALSHSRTVLADAPGLTGPVEPVVVAGVTAWVTQADPTLPLRARALHQVQVLRHGHRQGDLLPVRLAPAVSTEPLRCWLEQVAGPVSRTLAELEGTQEWTLRLKPQSTRQRRYADGGPGTAFLLRRRSTHRGWLDREHAIAMACARLQTVPGVRRCLPVGGTENEISIAVLARRDVQAIALLDNAEESTVSGPWCPASFAPALPPIQPVHTGIRPSQSFSESSPPEVR